MTKSNTQPLKRGSYGAKELKEVIRKNTVRATVFTFAGMALFFGSYYAYSAFGPKTSADLRPPLKAKRVSLRNLPPPPPSEATPPPPPSTDQILKQVARAGKPVAVPDALVTPEMEIFASVEDMETSDAQGSVEETEIDVEVEDLDIEVEVEEEIPDMYEFIPVEVQPSTDISALQKLVEYPDIAKRAGIEGTVYIRVYVGKDGKLQEAVVEHSDNEQLKQAALKAVKQATYSPGIQNGEPVGAWFSVPVVFQLR